VEVAEELGVAFKSGEGFGVGGECDGDRGHGPCATRVRMCFARLAEGELLQVLVGGRLGCEEDSGERYERATRARERGSGERGRLG
jgi:hypothetical protein